MRNRNEIEDEIHFITAPKRSRRWLCFHRCLSVHRGRVCVAGGCVAVGVCVAGGHAWWEGACMAGAVWGQG